jgi:hypothetical protein
MATIYTIVGEPEKAIDELEIALSIPSWGSTKLFKADPLFAPLHKHPRFITLMKKYESE